METKNPLTSEALQALSDENRKKLEELSKSFEGKKDELTELIRKYPLTSIAVAAGIGFLIGKLFSPKK